ncbi:MAG: hypothetical protein R2780_01880 [Crocinitomicaceae bacterium]|nr:hypothetical protein [Crocinitomicaceae bacterium]
MKPRLIITMLMVAIQSFAVENDPKGFPDDESLFRKDKEVVKKNLRAERPIGVNLTGFGPGGLVSGSIDGFLTPKIALEGGAGLRNEQGDVSYFLGGRYHLLGGTRLKMTPYVGVYTAFHNNGRDVQNHSIYVPVGLHKIKKSGFNWAVEAAFERNTFKEGNWTGAFKVGYRF